LFALVPRISDFSISKQLVLQPEKDIVAARTLTDTIRAGLGATEFGAPVEAFQDDKSSSFVSGQCPGIEGGQQAVDTLEVQGAGKSDSVFDVFTNDVMDLA
jgi:hypothetical protein